MGKEEDLLFSWRELTPEKQQQVLEYVEALKSESASTALEPVSNTLISDTSPNNATNQHQFSTPWVGIRQYTSQLSPKKTNPGYIARARAIYDSLRKELTSNYPSWYIVIEPDSGDYFLDADKELAKQKARQKYPVRRFCTFQLIPVAPSTTSPHNC